jgi:AsmA protein
MNLALTMDASRARVGSLQLEALKGKARITDAGLALDPASFGVFGGHYDGTLSLTLGATPTVRIKAKVSGIDVGAATAFAGSPGTISGKLAGDLDLTARGLDAAAVSRTAAGSLRVDVTDGVVKNLGLIQAVVLATSMRSGASSEDRGSRDEPFTHLGGTLGIGGGQATSHDLRFESKNVVLSLGGSARLDGSAIDFKGPAQLSDALSKQAGRDLVRYTQDNGRVTLPATVTGSAADPHVRLDVADLAKRAVTNRAQEEAKKAIGSFLKKR